MEQTKICIVGGCGHVGLPLGLAFAKAGFTVTLLDTNSRSVELVDCGEMPFLEHGDAQNVLQQTIGKNLKATSKADILRQQDVVVFVTGTPVDEHLSPRIHDVIDVVELYLPYLRSDQLFILRSTLYPGVTELVDQLLSDKLGKHKLAFCPERVAQGYGLKEINELPQIVAGTTSQATDESAALFNQLTSKVIILSPTEAELAKLMTNAWRYLEFAIANQFYIMVESQGLDFYKIFDALQTDYPRAKHFASPGLAAGPCLFKDTMQLSAFHENNFFLGHASMLINEGLPVFLVKQLKQQMGSVAHKKIGILGMSFKANNDDCRESLSYKIKKILECEMATVLASDVYNEETMSLTRVLEESDGFILGVPHREYLKLTIDKPFVDCWGVWRNRSGR